MDRPHWTAYAAGVFMLALLAGIVALWMADWESASVAWIPSWDAELGFRLDGLALLYSLIAAGIGFVVVVFSARYLPRHLEETGAPPQRQRRFYALICLFAFSMVGLALADDLVVLFVFWDLTAIASYFLIAFDREKEDARRGAFAAMMVTGVTAVFLLIGAVVLWAHYGTFSLERLFALARNDMLTTAAVALMLAAALAKSAQAPFHLWLPRAMVAPTPVSAYLHSAAMVAAGVLLIGRIYPLVEQSQALLDVLLGFGLVSIAVGSVLALSADELKRILAYSTVSQYGYVVTMYGLGGKVASGAAAFYVFGHAIEKSALFLTSGTIGQAVHTEKLSELGGLARRMPAVAVGSALAAAGIAALPLTVGFFQDELFFKAALERGWAAAAAAGAAAVLTLVYIGRFWGGIFAGSRDMEVDAVPRSLTLPVLALGLLVLAGGIWALPVESLASEAALASGGSDAEVKAKYHFDLRSENVLALGAYGIGALLLVSHGVWGALAPRAARLGERVGPDRIYTGSIRGLNLLSERIHRVEVRGLRVRVAAVLVPAGALGAAGLIASAEGASFAFGGLPRGDIQLAVALGAVVVGAVALAFIRLHLALALLLGATGYALAAVYAFFGAPDVALVAVLIETVLAILFFGVLALLPAELRRREQELPERRRDAVLAAIAGLFAFGVAWQALSGEGGSDAVGLRYPDLASEAHAKDTVTAILADFRGLDTIGEVSVVLVAVLGVVGLIRRGPLW